MKYFLILLTALSLATTSLAQTSETQEARAREIGSQLRCVVCQNQSIEESEADLAIDMKRIVRDRIAAGDSNQDVIAYMRDRYGDYVLLKPPVQSNTYLLWFGPFLLVLSGLGWFILRAKRKATAPLIQDLSEDDQALLNRLMVDES